MQLYGRVLSPFVMRPLLVAWAKGHELELAAAPDGLKSPAFLALNPIGKIPVLVDGDVVLPECQVIAEYLDAVLPGPATIAPDPAQAARERLLCRLADLYLMSEAQVLFGARENPGVVPAALEKLGLALGYIEHFRKAGDAFAAGDRFSIADAALIPIFFFLDVFAAQLPVAPLIAAQPGVAAWWAAAKASPLGSRAVAAQQEDFGRMMAERAAAA